MNADTTPIAADKGTGYSMAGIAATFIHFIGGDLRGIGVHRRLHGFSPP